MSCASLDYKSRGAMLSGSTICMYQHFHSFCSKVLSTHSRVVNVFPFPPLLWIHFGDIDGISFETAFHVELPFYRSNGFLSTNF